MELGKQKEKNLRSFGFDKEVDRTKFDLCPLCGNPIKIEDFEDALSRKEHKISGTCQKCQNEVFE